MAMGEALPKLEFLIRIKKAADSGKLYDPAVVLEYSA